MKKFYKSRNNFSLLLVSLFCCLPFLKVEAQTNNYHGSTGSIGGSTWSINPLGPFTNPFNTTGGGIANFGVAGIMTGGSITVSAINATANKTLASPSGTISNFSSGIVPINVDPGITLDFFTQNFTTAATAGYIKNGDGVLAMAGATYGGGFTLNAGTIIVRGINAMGGGATNSLTLNGGIVASNASRNLSNKYPIGITIGGNIQFGDIVGLASANATLLFNNNIDLGSTTRVFTMGNNGITTFSGVISGTRSIHFQAVAGATGWFELTNAANTFSRPIEVQGGELRIADNGSLGNSLNSLIINGGVFGNMQSTNLSLPSGRDINVGDNIGSAISVNGNTTISLTIGGIISNVSSQNGILNKIGAGRLILTNNNTYTGITNIRSGIVEIGITNSLPVVTQLQMGEAGTNNTGTLNLNGYNQTIGSLNSILGTNTSTTRLNTITSATAATLTINGAGDYGSNTTQNSGIITGAIDLVKSGTGTLTLGGANTYTGTTTITGGVLQLNRIGGNTLAATNTVMVNAGSLQVSTNQALASIVVAPNAELIVDAGATLTISNLLEIGAGAIISGGGTIVYAGGSLLYSGSGNQTVSFEWPNSSGPLAVTINSGVSVDLNASVSRNVGSSLQIDGTLTTNNASITGNGDVLINGTLISKNASGFTGSGASFTGSSVNIVLGTASVIEYGFDGNQQVQSFAPRYYNINITGSGVKNFISTQDTIDGLVWIKTSATLNVNNNRFGSSTPATKLQMDANSRYIQGFSVLTNPSMSLSASDYTIAPTATIEFSGSGNVNMRQAINYGNVEISGANVNLLGINGITMQSGTTFTVKNGATFKIANSNGLSGGINTAIRNTNSPTVVLENGSTVEYALAGNQTITTAVNYFNLNISGSGQKSMNNSIDLPGNLGLIGGEIVVGSNTLKFTSLTGSGGSIVANNANARVIFNNNSALTLPSGAFSSTVSRLLHEGSAAVSSSTDITVTDSLIINNHNLVTTSGSSVILGASAIVSESAGQVLGNLAAERFVTTTGEDFGGMGIFINPNVNMEETFVLRVTGETLSGSGPLCTNQSIGRYFEVTPTINSSLNASVEITYRTTDLGSLTEANLGIYKKPIGAPCNDWLPIASTLDATNKLISFSVNEFSVLTAGDTIAAPLPVKWLNARAIAADNQVVISWATIQEQNNSHFEILHSSNAVNWSVIGRVEGSGSSSVRNDYLFEHLKPNRGSNFYQIKQVDYDGEFSFSKTMKVDFKNGASIIVFPNPAKDQLQIKGLGSTIADLRIFSVSGQLLRQIQLVNPQETINVSDLASGIYLIEIQKQDKTKEHHWLQLIK